MNKFVDNVELFEYTSAAEPISDLIKPEIFKLKKAVSSYIHKNLIFEK